MVYGIILAAGIGERFKKTPIKPLFCIKNKPMFLYALDTFLKTKKIDKILLVINDQYKQQFQKYLTGSKYKNLLICNGCQGARWKSLINGVNYLASNFKINPTDIIITHDAARINVTPAIITNNILVASQCGYASTVLALHDSIMEFNSQAVYLERSHKYIVQTPQTFQYKY
jgi:2-C-methyl-D-erythritol 4-phosphate cytidylyltransferase